MHPFDLCLPFIQKAKEKLTKKPIEYLEIRIRLPITITFENFI